MTEKQTGIDIVKAQIRITEGAHRLAGKVSPQEAIRLRGHALQCRVTTGRPRERLPRRTGPHHRLPLAGPARAPRRRHAYPAGQDHAPLRLLLVKVTWGRTAPTRRPAVVHGSRAREFRIRGCLQPRSPSAERHRPPAFPSRPPSTRRRVFEFSSAATVPPGCSISSASHRQRQPRDEGTPLSGGHPAARPPAQLVTSAAPPRRAAATVSRASAPRAFAEWMREQPGVLLTDTLDARRPPVAVRHRNAPRHGRWRRTTHAWAAACSRSSAGVAPPSTWRCASQGRSLGTARRAGRADSPTCCCCRCCCAPPTRWATPATGQRAVPLQAAAAAGR